MHERWFWPFAEIFWYGRWPYIPLSFLFGIACAVVLAWLAREFIPELGPIGLLLESKYWRWPMTILIAIIGYAVWPLVIALCFVLVVIFAAVGSSANQTEADYD
jgi:hypothetical protein